MSADSKTLPTIQGIRAREVVVPARPGATDSDSLGPFMNGMPWPMMPIVLIEVRMSDGIVALGEVPRGPALHDLDSWLKRLPGIQLRGLSLSVLPTEFRQPSTWNLDEMYPTPLWASPSPLIAALEMVVFDWTGKRIGCRMVDLLGGAYREQVPVDYWCSRQTPADLERIVGRAVAAGFKGLKMKSRSGDPADAQLKAIKSVGGEQFGVTIDPMFQWRSPHDAMDVFRQLERAGPNVRIEDPFPQDRPEFWQRIRQATSVPLIWHARGIDSLRRALEARCADGFNCNGGILEFLTVAHAVEVAGYGCWHGSAIELGVGQVAHLHAAAASRCCVMAGDFVAGFVREHTLIQWDWPYQNGHLPLPTGDGIGVELDQIAVQRYAKANAVYGSF